jgi:glycosyltransferase involved in cell wall biosynthesis
LVSIVIPCYNQARFLHTAIESARRQGYRPLETIVVDDGSTDDTSLTAEHLGALVIRQPNHGVGAARNAGLRAARGDFVLFLDADDELLADAVQSGVEALTRNSTASCVVRLCQSMDAEGRHVPTQHPSVDTSDLYREWLLRNFVWTPGAAMFRRRSLVKIGGFDQSVGPTSDYALYLTLAHAGTVLFDRREVVRYRRHDEAMSTDPVLMLRSVLEVLDRQRVSLQPRHAAAFKSGRQAWREFYGEQIVEKLRHDWHERRADRWQLGAVFMLFRHSQAVMWANLKRKLTRVIRRRPLEKATPLTLDSRS